jgi:hypothetical protein
MEYFAGLDVSMEETHVCRDQWYWPGEKHVRRYARGRWSSRYKCKCAVDGPPKDGCPPRCRGRPNNRRGDRAPICDLARGA